MITENIDYDLDTTSIHDKGFLLLKSIFKQEAQDFLAIIKNILPATSDNRYQKAFFNNDIEKFGLTSFFKNQDFKKILHNIFLDGYVFSNNFFYRDFKKCQGTRAHADHVYFDQPNPLITVWVALSEITLDMGPLYILTKNESKHIATNEYLTQKINSNDATNNKGWEKAVLNLDIPVKTRELTTGDCYLFLSDVVHGTLDSKSSASRLSIDFRVTGSTDYDKRWFTTQYTN